MTFDRPTDRPSSSSSYDTSCGIRRYDDSSGALLMRDEAYSRVRMLNSLLILSLSVHFNFFLPKNGFDNLLNHSKDISVDRTNAPNLSSSVDAAVFFSLLCPFYFLPKVPKLHQNIAGYCLSWLLYNHDNCRIFILYFIEVFIYVEQINLFKKPTKSTSLIYLDIICFFPQSEWMEVFSWFDLESNMDGFIMLKFLRLSFDYSENKKVYLYTWYCFDNFITVYRL